MSDTITVSIGMPAFNEERNIKNVLEDIFLQKQEGWSLNEVAVYCDGCSDKTAERAREITHRLLLVKEFEERKSKTFRLNQMFKEFNGEVLLMLDADIKLADLNVITNLINTFKSSDNIMLVGGNSMPFPPKSFFQRAVFSTFEVFYDTRRSFKGGNNIFGCTGSILAIRNKFAKDLQIPKIFNEDAYIYLECIKRKYLFKYCDSAVIFYKVPSHTKDYIKQLYRSEPAAITVELGKYFGDLTRQELARPKGDYIKSIIKAFIKNPLGVVYIIAINLLCRPLIPIVTKNYKLSWFTAESTH